MLKGMHKELRKGGKEREQRGKLDEGEDSGNEENGGEENKREVIVNEGDVKEREGEGNQRGEK